MRSANSVMVGKMVNRIHPRNPPSISRYIYLIYVNASKTSFLNAPCRNKIVSTLFFFKCTQNLIT